MAMVDPALILALSGQRVCLFLPLYSLPQPRRLSSGNVDNRWATN